jgi:RNA polymerase sigma-70 factor (ECF subfamily)
VARRLKTVFASASGAMATQGRQAVEPLSTEDELIARSKEGDVGAFEQLVRRHSGRLYAVLVRFAGERAADDALQEALLRAWRSIGRFEARSSFFTWLYRIAINEAKRHAERQPQLGTTPDERQLDQLSDERSRPDRASERRELRETLEAAIRKLPFEYRLPLVLRDIEGLTTREAAVIMELSEPAFKSRLHRARMAVREAVEPQLEE